MTEAGDAPIGHVGWSLWRAARAWKAAFVAAMAADGYAWFGDARAELLGLIPPEGIGQSALTGLSGLSRQAVQQSLDLLVADGMVERRPDPTDGRRFRVQATASGRAALAAATCAKRRIEADYLDRLGPEGFARLMAALEAIAPNAGSSDTR
jgi:DNA-binding MarR family transcriptional regulator